MNDQDQNIRKTASHRAEAANPGARDDRLLFSTENGWVRHCACHDVMILHFLGHWMPLTRLGYRDFHERLIRAVRCPLAQVRDRAEGAHFVFHTEGGENAFSLNRAEMEELLWLLDSARYMLDAHDAAARGFAAAPAGSNREFQRP